jgi:hypothetical protein
MLGMNTWEHGGVERLWVLMPIATSKAAAPALVAEVRFRVARPLPGSLYAPHPLFRSVVCR